MKNSPDDARLTALFQDVPVPAGLAERLLERLRAEAGADIHKGRRADIPVCRETEGRRELVVPKFGDIRHSERGEDSGIHRNSGKILRCGQNDGPINSPNFGTTEEYLPQPKSSLPLRRRRWVQLAASLLATGAAIMVAVWLGNRNAQPLSRSRSSTKRFALFRRQRNAVCRSPRSPPRPTIRRAEW